MTATHDPHAPMTVRSEFAHASGLDPSLADDQETGGAAFPVVLRGYHRAEVDRRIAELEGRLAEALARAEGVGSAPDTTDGSTEFSVMGEKVAAILRAANASAEGLLADARSNARGLQETVGREAEKVRGSSEAQAAELVGSARMESDRLRHEAQAEAERLLAASRAEAEQILAECHRRAQAERQEEARSRELRLSAVREAEAFRAAAVEEAESVRAAVADEAAVTQARARETAARLVAQAEERASWIRASVAAEERRVEALKVMAQEAVGAVAGLVDVVRRMAGVADGDVVPGRSSSGTRSHSRRAGED